MSDHDTAMWQTTGRLHIREDDDAMWPIARIVIQGVDSLTAVDLFCEGDDLSHLDGSNVEVTLTIHAAVTL